MAAGAIQAALSELVSERNVVVTRDVSYGPERRHRLDLYEPPRERTGGPVCVFFYGGSWRNGDRAGYGFVGAALASRGVTTIVPDYRLFPEVRFPAFVEDGALAFQWAAAWLASERARPILVAGHSAGAHIAALLALDSRYLAKAPRRPDGLAGLAGPYAFDPVTWPSTAEIFSQAERKADTRPITHVTQASPPALLVHGLADTLVKPWNSEQLAAAYRAQGRPVEQMPVDGFGHLDPLLAIARPLRWRAPVLDRMVRFAARLRTGG